MAAAETANDATNRATDVADRRHQRARIKILARPGHESAARNTSAPLKK